MDVGRRTVLAGSGAALAAPVFSSAWGQSENPLAASIAADGESIKVVKILALDDGAVQILNTDVAADHSPYPLFKQFLTHKASRVAAYGAPAGHKAAAVPATRQLTFIVAGEMTLVGKGTRRSCPAGTAILADAGSRYHEHAGPAGYTAIKVALAN
jgi:hypothetical protein